MQMASEWHFAIHLQEVYAILYIRSEWKETEMKVTRRSDSGKSGHLLISVPASRVAEVEAALAFLEVPAARVTGRY